MKKMKKRRMYYAIAVIATVGFISCGPTQGTNDADNNRTGTETTTDRTGNGTGNNQ